MAAIVHCRYGQGHGDDGTDLPGGWVWLCYGPIGPMDMPGEDLPGCQSVPFGYQWYLYGRSSTMDGPLVTSGYGSDLGRLRTAQEPYAALPAA